MLSHVQLFVTPRTAAHQASLSFTISWSLLKLMSIESVITSKHLILCHPLLLLPSIFPNIKVFSSELVLHISWPKYWSFSFSISPSNEYSELISFTVDWFDLLTVQGSHKSLLQHHSSKAPILWHSAFFMVQLLIGFWIVLMNKASICTSTCLLGLPQWLSSKESSCNAGGTGDANLIPGSVRSPGEGNGNLLQYSCLKNPMDKEAQQPTVQRSQREGQDWATKQARAQTQELM